MTFGEAIKSGFSNYATFAGRAPRSGYWYWYLFVLLASICLSLLDSAVFPLFPWQPLSTIASIAFLLPGFAVGARRLHDINRTGWWQLLYLTGIGVIVLIIFACQRGDEGDNRFGPNPLKLASTIPPQSAEGV